MKLAIILPLALLFAAHYAGAYAFSYTYDMSLEHALFHHGHGELRSVLTRFPHGSSTSGGACPNGSADLTDPCPLAPIGASYTIGSLPALAQGSNQVWVAGAANPGLLVSPQTNLPAINYSIGPYTSRALATDALDPSGWGGGCSSSDHTYWYEVDCNGPAGGHLYQNLDFGPNPTTWYSGRSHAGPVKIHFHNSTTGTQTFNDDWFGNDQNCNVAGSGFGDVGLDNGSTAGLIFTSNYVDENDQNGNPTTGCRYQGFQLNSINWFGSGGVLIKYSVFLGVPGRPVNLNCATAGGAIDEISANVFVDYNMLGHTGHGELGLLQGSSSPSTCGQYYLHHNAFILTTQTGLAFTAPVYFDNGSHPAYNDWNYVANLTNTNFVGGQSANALGTLTAHSSANTTTCSSGCYNTVTIDSVSGSGTPLSPGTDVAFGSVHGNLMYQTNGSTASGGAGTVWYMECYQPTSSGCPSGYAVDSRNVSVPGNGAISTSSGAYSNYQSSAGVFEADATYHQLIVTRNMFDVTGAENWGAYATLGGTCSVTTTFSGNVNLVSGSSVSPNVWSHNTGTGC